MKRMFLTMAALSALAAAAPAAAQYGYSRHDDGLLDRRIDQLDYRLEDGIRRGAISRDEAYGLRTQLWQIRRLEGQYGRNGFSSWELSDLDRRIRFLRDQLRGAEGPYYGRSGGYDERGDSYDSDDRGYAAPPPGYDPQRDDDPTHDDRGYRQDHDPGIDMPGIQPFDPNDDPGFDAGDDRGFDRPYPRGGDEDGADGRLDSGEGGYVPGDRPAPSDFDVPANDDDGTAGPLRIGDPAPSDLGPVPSHLRGRYPDGSGVYYRYDGETIYQIDARTNMIRWIGDLPQ